MTHPHIEPGDVLLEKYRVDRVIGTGGMGFVVAVCALDTDERFAIKVMHLDGSSNVDAQRRFYREARACMRFCGPHTVRVYDVGRLDDGSWFMRMEYLEGADLKQHLAVRGALTVQEAVDCIWQAGNGLVEAHAQGIVHRDIKPANLFLVRQPNDSVLVKVIDFGISKQPAGEVSRQLTGTGAMLGSPLYMSPEQMMQARDVDVRSDIWSVGVVLYELIAGSPPFKGATFTKIVHQVLHSAPISLQSLQPLVPAELDKIVMKCLEKDPDKRFATMNDVLVSLSGFLPRAEKTRMLD